MPYLLCGKHISFHIILSTQKSVFLCELVIHNCLHAIALIIIINHFGQFSHIECMFIIAVYVNAIRTKCACSNWKLIFKANVFLSKLFASKTWFSSHQVFKFWSLLLYFASDNILHCVVIKIWFLCYHGKHCTFESQDISCWSNVLELLRRDERLLYACISSVVIIKPPPLPVLFCCMLSKVSLGVKQCVRGRNFTNEYLLVASRFLVFCKRLGIWLRNGN